MYWEWDVSRLDDLFEGLPQHLTVDQLATVLGIRKQTVYKYLQNQTVPAYKVGGSWMILRDDIKDWLYANRNRAVPEDRPGQAGDDEGSTA